MDTLFGKVGNRLYAKVGADGKVTWAEFAPLIQTIGWPIQIAQRMWYDTDQDKSGVLEKDEFMGFCQRSDVAPYIQKLEANLPKPVVGDRLFHFMDGNGHRKDNNIAWTEFCPMIVSVGWDQATASKMWYETDTDKSGVLSKEEFLCFCAQPAVSPHIARLEKKVCKGQGQAGTATATRADPYASTGQAPYGGSGTSSTAPYGGSGAGNSGQAAPAAATAPAGTDAAPTSGGSSMGSFFKDMLTGQRDDTTTTTGNVPTQAFLSSCNGNKKALFIGINYTGSSAALRGCINDVQNIRRFVVPMFKIPEQQIVQLTDDASDPNFQPTRANIEKAMQWLVQGAKEGDSLFLHYSGHGAKQRDTDQDEKDGNDETICPVDFQKAGQITDDELHTALVKPLPRGVRLTAIFDSCHSGSVLDLPFSYNVSGNLEITEVDNRKEAMKQGIYAMGNLMIGNKQGASRNAVAALGHLLGGGGGAQGSTQKAQEEKKAEADVVQFAGCRDDQTSADATIGGAATGAMSYAFIEVLKQNSQPTYCELLKGMRTTLKGKYTQIPQMSTGNATNMNIKFFM